MVAEERLNRALRTLANGGASVWAPEITTSQQVHTPALRLALVQTKGMANRWSSNAEWLVWYLANALPDDATPAWTKVLSGAFTPAATEGLLSVPVTGAGHLYYTREELVLGNARGVTVEARVRVTAAATGTAKGAMLTAQDGVKQHAAFLRTDGCNLAGGAAVAVDLTSWRRVRLVGQGTGSRLYVDDVLVQERIAAAATTARVASFGSFAPDPGTLWTAGTSTSVWDWVRLRGGV